MHVEKQERSHSTFSFASEAKCEGRRAKVFTLIALCTNKLSPAGEEVKVKNENRLTRARTRTGCTRGQLKAEMRRSALAG